MVAETASGTVNLIVESEANSCRSDSDEAGAQTDHHTLDNSQVFPDYSQLDPDRTIGAVNGFSMTRDLLSFVPISDIMSSKVLRFHVCHNNFQTSKTTRGAWSMVCICSGPIHSLTR
jgi:hypothetical protein